MSVVDLAFVLSAALPAQPNATATSAAAAIKPPDLVILSPVEYQVFQRHSRTRGPVFFSGRTTLDCEALEARFLGKGIEGPLSDRWERIAIDTVTGSFNSAPIVPAGGWYRLDIRLLKAGKTVAERSIAHVGVGEVFVGAGQSNSTNCGGEGKLKTETGMVATFDGADWRIADDPQPGVHDKSTGGSFWPAFGDAMYEKYQVPIGLAVTGHGGTSIKQWQPGSDLFEWMMTRVRQLGRGRFRAVLWHQGESDVTMTSEDYARGLAAIIAGSKSAAGWDFPWFVAQVSYHNPDQPSFPSTREGQKMLWEARIALQGPDTDTLTGDNRDQGGKGIHFSPKGLKAHGRMWAIRVGVYLDKALSK